MVKIYEIKKPDFSDILQKDQHPLVHCIPLSNNCTTSIHKEYRRQLKLGSINKQFDLKIGNVKELTCKNRSVFCLITRDYEDHYTEQKNLNQCLRNLKQMIVKNGISDISLHKESFDNEWSKVSESLDAIFKDVNITIHVYEISKPSEKKKNRRAKKIAAKLPPEEASVPDERPQQVDKPSSTVENKSQTNVTSVNINQQSRRGYVSQIMKIDSDYQRDNQGRPATTKEETADYFKSLVCGTIKKFKDDPVNKYSIVVFTTWNLELNKELLHSDFFKNKYLKVPEVYYVKGQYCVALCSRDNSRVPYVTLMEALIRLRRKCLAAKENRIVIRTDNLGKCMFQFNAMNVKSLIYMVFLNSNIDVSITPFTDQDYGRLDLSKCFKMNKNSSHLDVITGNLFSCPKNYALAHCVAQDLLMGAGIAVEFKKRFNEVQHLYDQWQYTGGLAKLVHDPKNGDPKRNVYYLITKAVSWGKPTHETLMSSLIQMRIDCENDSVTNLAMPMIGCGLDRLKWPIVEDMILAVFKGIKISIEIYTLDDPNSTQNSIDKPTTSEEANETKSWLSEKRYDRPTGNEQKTKTMVTSASDEKWSKN